MKIKGNKELYTEIKLEEYRDLQSNRTKFDCHIHTVLEKV